MNITDKEKEKLYEIHRHLPNLHSIDFLGDPRDVNGHLICDSCGSTNIHDESPSWHCIDCGNHISSKLSTLRSTK